MIPFCYTSLEESAPDSFMSHLRGYLYCQTYCDVEHLLVGLLIYLGLLELVVGCQHYLASSASSPPPQVSVFVPTNEL